MCCMGFGESTHGGGLVCVRVGVLYECMPVCDEGALRDEGNGYYVV